MPTPFETYVNTNLPLALSILTAPTAGNFLRATGVGRLTEERTPAQLLADIGGAAASDYLPLAGGTMTGSIAMGGNNITGGGQLFLNSSIANMITLTRNADFNSYIAYVDVGGGARWEIGFDSGANNDQFFLKDNVSGLHVYDIDSGGTVFHHNTAVDIVGAVDTRQLLVVGWSTQTANILQVETFAGNRVLTVDNNEVVAVPTLAAMNDSDTYLDLTNANSPRMISGAFEFWRCNKAVKSEMLFNSAQADVDFAVSTIGTTSLFKIDANLNHVGINGVTNGLFGIEGRANEVQLYVESFGTQTTDVVKFNNGTIDIFNITDAGAVTFADAYTFPTVDGLVDQILSTNGSKVLSWVNAGGASSAPFDDATAIVKANDDATKLLRLDVGGTTGITGILATTFTTAKTITFPDATDTVVLLAATQTLSNKTLAGFTLSGDISVNPAGADITGLGRLWQLGQATEILHKITAWSTPAAQIVLIESFGGTTWFEIDSSGYLNIADRLGHVGDATAYMQFTTGQAEFIGGVKIGGIVYPTADGLAGQCVVTDGLAQLSLATRAQRYELAFTNATLVSGVLTVTHSLGEKFVTIQVTDNNDVEVTPDTVTRTSTSACTIDFSTFGSLTGTWNVVVIG